MNHIKKMEVLHKVIRVWISNINNDGDIEMRKKLACVVSNANMLEVEWTKLCILYNASHKERYGFEGENYRMTREQMREYVTKSELGLIDVFNNLDTEEYLKVILTPYQHSIVDFWVQIYHFCNMMNFWGCPECP